MGKQLHGEGLGMRRSASIVVAFVVAGCLLAVGSSAAAETCYMDPILVPNHLYGCWRREWDDADDGSCG